MAFKPYYHTTSPLAWLVHPYHNYSIGIDNRHIVWALADGGYFQCSSISAPECISEHQKLPNSLQTPLEWMTAGNPCSLLQLMTLHPSDGISYVRPWISLMIAKFICLSKHCFVLAFFFQLCMYTTFKYLVLIFFHEDKLCKSFINYRHIAEVAVHAQAVNTRPFFSFYAA